jgi:hypothetical protein
MSHPSNSKSCAGRHSRRDVLKAAAVVLPALSAGVPGLPLAAAPKAGAGRTPSSITGVRLELDRIHKWDDSNGDTWDPFWADDDNLYAFNCDGRGFGTAPRNLAFHRLSGNSLENLSGALVNSMDEYGAANKKEADNATWKACGQECIDSVFYAFVSRNAYGSDSGDFWLRQTAFNSSLIKSSDRGQTWTRSATENYARPMWPGPSFGTPFFVHYGRNGGSVTKDGADRFVYALSNNGFWNDGDRYILGRVVRTKLAGLNASDWSYFTGGEGSAAKSWSPKIQDAHAVFELPVRCGQTPPCFIPALGAYLMVVWYNTSKMKKWFEPDEMRYDFYQAQHPWGPWSAIESYSDRFLGAGHMYGPSLCSKFQRRLGNDVEMVLFTSGCPFDDVPEGLYKAWAIPVTVTTGPAIPSESVASDDARIEYKGSWAASSEGRLLGAVRQTSSANDSAELSFTGVGVDYIAGKGKNFGSVDVYLDGALAQSVDLSVKNLPGLRGITVFRASGLRNGPHQVRIVSRAAATAVVEGFRVYGGA